MDRTVKPVDVAAVSDGILTDLKSPCVGEATDDQAHEPSMTEACPTDRTVDLGAVVAEASDDPAHRPVDQVDVAALDADIAVDVVVLGDPDPDPATDYGHMVMNYAAPSLLPILE